MLTDSRGRPPFCERDLLLRPPHYAASPVIPSCNARAISSSFPHPLPANRTTPRRSAFAAIGREASGEGRRENARIAWLKLCGMPARARARHTHICNGQAFVKWNLKFLTQAFRVRNLRDEKRRETFDEIRRSIFLAQIRANSIVSRWGRAIGMSNGDAKTEIERHTAILYSQRFYPECVA